MCVFQWDVEHGQMGAVDSVDSCSWLYSYKTPEAIHGGTRVSRAQ